MSAMFVPCPSRRARGCGSTSRTSACASPPSSPGRLRQDRRSRAPRGTRSAARGAASRRRPRAPPAGASQKAGSASQIWSTESTRFGCTGETSSSCAGEGTIGATRITSGGTPRGLHDSRRHPAQARRARRVHRARDQAARAREHPQFFDHRREYARTDWENGGVPRQEWEELLARDARGAPTPRASCATRCREELGGQDGSNLAMAIIREHLAAQGPRPAQRPAERVVDRRQLPDVHHDVGASAARSRRPSSSTA